MNKRFFIIIFFIFFIAFHRTYSQIYPRWTAKNVKRVIFLKSIDTLCPQFNYWSLGNSNSINIIKTLGYAMDEYVKSEHNLEIVLRKCGTNDLKYKESEMIIDLYFKQIPESINYYLEIPKFNAGQTIRKFIPPKLNKVINMDDKRREPIFGKNRIT